MSSRVPLPAYVSPLAITCATVVLACAPLCAPHAAEAAESSQSAAEQFDVLELRVLGNSVLSAEQIERTLYPYVGPGRKFEDLEAARTALEAAYRSAGYATVFVDIPEQSVGSDGVVRLQVTEGRVDRVRITGARYFANGKLRQAVPALTKGAVPHLPQVQAELEGANRQSRDRVITPVMKAGRTPGAIDVELKVKDELPLHASLEVNDRYTADTSHARASLNVSYDDLWQKFHSLSLQYQTAPEEPDEARVIAGTYLMPVTGSGHMLAAYAVDTSSDVATVGTLSVLGAGRIYGMRYIVPLPALGGFHQSVSMGGDYKDFEESILLTPGVTDRTPIQYMTWSVSYNGNARTDASATAFNLSSSFGFRGVVNDEEEFEYKRFRARPNFFYLRGGAQYEHTLSWGTRGVLRVSGQYAVEPLISNEQFSIGGAESVRGYLESETLGDIGAAGTLEWQSPSLARWLPYIGDQTYAFVFADGGVVSILHPLPGQDSRSTLSSVGLGLRLAAFDGLEAAVDGAYTLQDSDRTDAHDTRVHFQVRYGF